MKDEDEEGQDNYRPPKGPSHLHARIDDDGMEPPYMTILRVPGHLEFCKDQTCLQWNAWREGLCGHPLDEKEES